MAANAGGVPEKSTPPVDAKAITNGEIAGGGAVVETGNGTGATTGSKKKPGQNLQNVIRNNPITKAIDKTLDRIKDRLDGKKNTTSGGGTSAPADTAPKDDPGEG